MVSSSSYPSFYLVGHPKCGTTALYHALRGHPDIFMPEFKEPNFFAEDLRPRFDPPGWGWPRTPEAYLALFADATPGQCVGEASAGYLRSGVAAARIAEVRPDAKLIAILREPASFLHSLYLQARRNHNETARTLREALALESKRRRGECIPASAYRPQALLYSEWVAYTAQLRRVYSVFPPEQVLVLVYEEYRADNAATVREVLRFIGVRDSVALSVPRSNQSVRLRSRHLDSALNDLSFGRGPARRLAHDAITTLVPRAVRRQVLSFVRGRVIYGKPPPPDPELMSELRLALADEVSELSEYLRRDFLRIWGYSE